MIDLSQIVHCENTFARAFSRVAKRGYGFLYYSPDNPQSHDSNHAVITDPATDPAGAIDDLTAFYEGLGVRPRVYGAFAPGEREVLLPMLRARGFSVLDTSDRFYVLAGKSTISASPDLEVRRVRELDEGITAIVRAENDGEGDWTLGVLRYQLARDQFHLLVGYAGGTAVTMASVDLMDGLSRVDDVVTHPAYRQRGFGRTLIHHLVDYHRRVTANTLYLYTSIPSAARIYLAAGFSEIDWDPGRWSAWLPASDTAEGAEMSR